jgi:molybdate transport system substrate-binding protein
VTRRLAVIGAVLAVTGCGSSATSMGPTIRLAAAPALGPTLKACAPHIAGVRVRLELRASRDIGEEIRRGVLPDVFLASNTGVPRALARDHRVATPVAFATNSLVIAVPAGDRSIRSLADLGRPGTSLAMGTVSGSLGMYTRTVLAGVQTDQRIAILAKVTVEEDDATRLVQRLVSQSASAGFVFASDVEASGGRLRSVVLPRQLGATVVYSGATVTGAPQPKAAGRVMDDVLHGDCARALRRAGFGPPPR